MIKKLLRLFHTLRFLRWEQIVYRLYYLIRKKIRSFYPVNYTIPTPCPSYPLAFSTLLTSQKIVVAPLSFIFLNQKHTFVGSIDWNYAELGKLWTYNLCYFDFLQQADLSKDEKIALIDDFLASSAIHKDALEPYPISLRVLNWIKFFSSSQTSKKTYDTALFRDLMILDDHLEYHLLGNHLLENSFALLFGSYYFHHEHFYRRAKKILEQQLDEQILTDGAHFELSPMYHAIILFRLLDCYNLIIHNDWKKDNSFQNFLHSKIGVMLGWMETIALPDGGIPLLNDSAYNIAPLPTELLNYAKSLDITALVQPLTDCGYRKISTNRYTLYVDIGEIGPSYIPGHAHSDTFNFELYVDKKPLLIETGTSTYATNRQRSYERSTAAHNTVLVNGREQSDVWGSFRVGQRATITQKTEKLGMIEATHDGYRSLGVFHTRRWSYESDKITITDLLSHPHDHRPQAKAYFHFAPGIEPLIKESTLSIGEITIKFYDLLSIECTQTFFSPEFSVFIPRKTIIVTFQSTLITEIIL